MSYDLVIRNGTVVDGSGLARYRADVGVKDGRIARIGRIAAPADETVDAEGHVVTPGFVDGHTHMDAQLFWDELGSCSCYHGVTTAVMGNCGFTLAPCREAEADLVFRNLERAEDIDRNAMLTGIDWSWETFPEFMKAVDAVPKGINYAGYIGHAALRTYVMGERAFEEEAGEDDLKAMEAHVRDAVRAGALGFSTSRSPSHLTSDDRPVASRVATFSEVQHLVRAMGDEGAGIFQLAMERGGDNEMMAFYQSLIDLSAETGRPVTFGSLSRKERPGQWRAFYDLISEGNRNGANVFTQVHAREINTVLSFETSTPFDKREVWREVRALPLEEQKRAFADPEMRARLIEVASREHDGAAVVGAEARPPEWDIFFWMDRIRLPHRSLAEIAAERGVHPAEAMVDIALEQDLKAFFRQPIANENLDDALELMRHPYACTTFSDSGAHVSQIVDCSLQTHLLSHWVREREEFTLEEGVRKITYDTATRWGFHDRGLLREGLKADIVVFDPDRVAPAMPEVVHDLPAGAKRLKQYAVGMKATVVNGVPTLVDNEPTGRLAGQLLRGPARRLMRIEPFRAAVEEAALDDLKRRLARTRQPVWPDGGGWEFGIERGTLADTLAYWQDGFDWRAVEARLNAWPQFRTEIDGIPVHFIHTRHADPDAPALVLTHGWPGSVLEFLDALPALSARAHVVVPHLPGYGFSSPVTRPVYSREVAGLWRRLMAALGYERFVAQGGDWGSLVTCWLGCDHPDAVRAIHLNMLIMRPDMGALDEPLDETEKAWIGAMRRTVDLEGGYLRIQATKPQSLAVGLSDSPAGLCAWILEKFYGWPDAGSTLDRDLVLGNIALYWFTNTLASSAWMYATVLDRKHYMLPAGERITVPTGMAHFPNDTYPMAPRRWLERIAPVVRWTDMPRGGHFAAMEEPALFAEEVLAFLDQLDG